MAPVLGTRGKGHKEFPNDASPCALPSTYIMDVNTSINHFAGRNGPAQWWSFGPIAGPAGIYTGRRPPKVIESSRQSLQVTDGLMNEVVSSR
jgi:hypothetical protein